VLEKDIVKKIMKYLKTVPECFAWKTHGGAYGKSGIPDIIACVSGRFYAFEVKQPGGKLTKLQEATIRSIIGAKGEAHTVTDLREVQSILSSMEVTRNGNPLDLSE